MAGKYRRFDNHHVRCMPPERWLESHPRLSAFALNREGVMVEGAQATLQTAYGGCRLEKREGCIWLDSQPIQLTPWHLDPTVPVFVCPLCQCRRHRLSEVGGVWACARCHGLSPMGQHVGRTIPGFGKLRRLCKKIGIEPFSTEIPDRPWYAHRYWETVREIRRLESALIYHLREDVSGALEMRHE
jgi:hypothetical protein